MIAVVDTTWPERISVPCGFMGGERAHGVIGDQRGHAGHRLVEDLAAVMLGLVPATQATKAIGG